MCLMCMEYLGLDVVALEAQCFASTAFYARLVSLPISLVRLCAPKNAYGGVRVVIGVGRYDLSHAKISPLSRKEFCFSRVACVFASFMLFPLFSTK